MPVLFSLVFIGIGAALLVVARGQAAKARLSLSWPSVEGQVAHSAVLFQPRVSAGSGDAATYRADVAYRYKVRGADFSSSKISMMDFSTSGAARAQAVAARYPDQSRVLVYYNPADPSDAVLEPGATGGINVLYIIGGIFAAGGLFFLAMSLTGRVHVA